MILYQWRTRNIVSKPFIDSHIAYDKRQFTEGEGIAREPVYHTELCPVSVSLGTRDIFSEGSPYPLCELLAVFSTSTVHIYIRFIRKMEKAKLSLCKAAYSKTAIWHEKP